MAGLQNHLAGMYREIDTVLVEMKPIDRRMGQLTEHIRQAGIRKQHRPTYEEYKALKPRKQKKFAEENKSALVQYKAASEYLKGHRNDKNQIPIQAWKKELAALSQKREGIYARYASLKDEAKAVGRLRHNVEAVLNRERARTRPQNRNRSRGMGR